MYCVKKICFPLLLALLAAGFVASGQHLKQAPRAKVEIEMQVAVPLLVQVVMAMGDRYLAANLAAIRAVIVAPEKMQPDEFRLLAKVQEDVAWLNPGHEDNYYTAFAVLSQYDQMAAAQRILARAAKTRYFDYQPAFFYGFNQWYYLHDPLGAAAWLREAARGLPDPDQRLVMQNMAARWVDKADDTELAISVVEALAKEARRKDFKDYLELRVVRLRQLQQLRQAAQAYQMQFGQSPASLDDLVRKGLVTKLPVDPFGFGFEFDKQGIIVLRTSHPQS